MIVGKDYIMLKKRDKNEGKTVNGVEEKVSEGKLCNVVKEKSQDEPRFAHNLSYSRLQKSITKC